MSKHILIGGGRRVLIEEVSKVAFQICSVVLDLSLCNINGKESEAVIPDVILSDVLGDYLPIE